MEVLIDIVTSVPGVYWYARQPTSENEFSSISQSIELIRKVLTCPIIETKIIFSSIRSLAALQQRLASQPSDTEERKRVKRNLSKNLTKLQSYATRLQQEINKLAKTVLAPKHVANDDKIQNVPISSIHNKLIASHDVFKIQLTSFLALCDWARASSACKTWKEKLYKMPLQHKLMFLSVVDNAVMRLPTPAPRWGELNRARQEALGVWYPFAKRDKMQELPKLLAKIVIKRTEQEQRELTKRNTL